MSIPFWYDVVVIGLGRRGVEYGRLWSSKALLPCNGPAMNHCPGGYLVESDLTYQLIVVAIDADVGGLVVTDGGAL